MSKRFQQLQKIRSWSVEQVQIQLKHYGLVESSEGVRKREVDGDTLLNLTEGKLALWRDVNVLEKKQLLKLIHDLQEHPENYTESLTKPVVQTPKPDVVPDNPGSNSPVSDAESWDTDFSDDKDVEYSNFDGTETAERPTIPARPPVLAPKPENLPKPPLPPENSCYGHVLNIVSGLNMPDHHDVYDEEEYESLDADAVVHKREVMAALVRQPSEQSFEEYESIKEHAEAADYYLQPIQPPVPPPPVPDKKWTQTPPRRHSDDISPGNSGDGLFGGLFRKIRGPDSKERTPTPTTPTSSIKPLPPEPRSGALNTHRPLPPTPQSKGVKSRHNTKLELTQQPWYHNVDRKQSEELLKNGEDGSFLVRPSSQGHNALTLTLWYNGRLYNISIRHRSDGRYALGTEKAKEQSFTSVEELIENYKSEKLVLYSGGEKTGRALLTTSPPC